MSQSSEPLVLEDNEGRVHEFLEGYSCAVYEYCEGGNLLEMAINKFQSQTEKLSDLENIRNIYQQIFEGINFLHNKLYYAHLNLTLKSIFLDSLGLVKIGGLGNAKPFYEVQEKLVLDF